MKYIIKKENIEEIVKKLNSALVMRKKYMTESCASGVGYGLLFSGGCSIYCTSAELNELFDDCAHIIIKKNRVEVGQLYVSFDEKGTGDCEVNIPECFDDDEIEIKLI